MNPCIVNMIERDKISKYINYGNIPIPLKSCIILLVCCNHICRVRSTLCSPQFYDCMCDMRMLQQDQISNCGFASESPLSVHHTYVISMLFRPKLVIKKINQETHYTEISWIFSHSYQTSLHIGGR